MGCDYGDVIQCVVKMVGYVDDKILFVSVRKIDYMIVRVEFAFDVFVLMVDILVAVLCLWYSSDVKFPIVLHKKHRLLASLRE